MDNTNIKNFIEKLLGQEDLVCLGDVADIRKPLKRSGTGKNFGGYTYPIDYTKLVEKDLTDLQAQRYDIVLRGGAIGLLYMVDEEPAEPIYYKRNDLVLRPNGMVQPEYIYLFLKSQTGQELMSCFRSASGPPILSLRQVKELYIPRPTLSEKEYRKTFEIENHYQLDMASYNDLIADWKEEEKQSIAAIFNLECLETILNRRQDEFTRMVRQDVEELKLCFHSKAYKATLIMAGSVLEAVLIDWLSEKHGINYLYKDYFVEKERKDGTTYWAKANLHDYITAIEELEAPNWTSEAEMADCIREKRNLVHAKLGIKSDEVNEDTCRMVIDYLEKVIETRAERMAYRYDKR